MNPAKLHSFAAVVALLMLAPGILQAAGGADSGGIPIQTVQKQDICAGNVFNVTANRQEPASPICEAARPVNVCAPPLQTPPGPAWINDLILYSLRIDTFAPTVAGESPFQSAKDKLDYLADLGITGVIINPAATKAYSSDPVYYNWYGTKEPDSLDPLLGTVQDYQNFTARAHQLGIKVIQDVVTHGVTFDSSLVTSHPDWFQHDSHGNIIGTWGGADFNFSKTDLVNWYVDTLVDDWAVPLSLDGFRCDCEPIYTGYGVFNLVRERAAAKGRELVFIAEQRNSRGNCYHMSQLDFGARHPYGPEYDFFVGASIVDTVPTLDESYYTHQLSSHDYWGYSALGRPVYFGYPMLLSPFIPLWRMGEEFNATDLGPKSYYFMPIVDPGGATLQALPIGAGESRGQDFLIPSDVSAIRIKAWANVKDAGNQLRLTLYRSAPSKIYQDTIATTPLFQTTVAGFGDGEWITIYLSPAPPPGHHLLVFDQPQGNVGIYGAATSYGGTSFLNGVGNTTVDIVMDAEQPGYGSVLYFSKMDWASVNLTSNHQFLEKVKRMIQVRKDYEYIIHPPMERMKGRNFIGVPTTGTDIDSYATFEGSEAIVVAGRLNSSSAPVTLDIPVSQMNMSGFPVYRLTQLLKDPPTVTEVPETALSSYTFTLARNDVAAILVQGILNGTNIALGKPTSASSGSGSAGYANDGDRDTFWSSGGPAPAWLRIDLRHTAKITGVKLRARQLPNGSAAHELRFVYGNGTQALVKTFSGYSKDGQWKYYIPSAQVEDVRYVNVSTVSSCSWVAWSEIEVWGFMDNLQPLAPGTPAGPANGFTGTSYQFSTVATDPDGDNIRYGWDWDGDDNVDEWSNLAGSGTLDTRSHTWTSAGIHNVKVMAQDEFGANSSWSSALQVTITGPTVPEMPVYLILVVSIIATEYSIIVISKRKHRNKK